MYTDTLKHKAIVHYKYFLKSIRKVSSIYKIGLIYKRKRFLQRRTKDSILTSINSFINQELDKNPFVTSLQLSKLVYKSLGLHVSKTTCWRSIRSNNYSFLIYQIFKSSSLNSSENDFKKDTITG